MAQFVNAGGIPKLFWHGTQGSYNMLVLELLGPSLEGLFEYCGRRFSLKTTLMLADQMVGGTSATLFACLGDLLNAKLHILLAR